MIVRRTQKTSKQPAKDDANVLATPASSTTRGNEMFRLMRHLRVIFGRRGPAGGEVFGSRAIPQATPRTSETPNTSPPPGPCRGTKKRPCARWIRMPDRGSLWLLPSGPDQIRNMSSSEPIERARRSVYLTRSRPPRQDS